MCFGAYIGGCSFRGTKKTPIFSVFWVHMTLFYHFPHFLEFLNYIHLKLWCLSQLLRYDWWKSEKPVLVINLSPQWYVYDTLMVDRGINNPDPWQIRHENSALWFLKLPQLRQSLPDQKYCKNKFLSIKCSSFRKKCNLLNSWNKYR